MKIAVAGKGGSGKTTLAGTIARVVSRAGHSVLAVDGDTNPMLGISLGLGPDRTDLLLAARQAVDDGRMAHQPSVSEVVKAFGADAPDGVRLVVVSRLEQIEPDCP